jgi:hypothetical protein
LEYSHLNDSLGITTTIRTRSDLALTVVTNNKGCSIIADLKRNRQAVSDLEREIEALKRRSPVELQNANSGTVLATDTSMKST